MGGAFLVNDHLSIPLSARSCNAASLAPGTDVALVVRPETMRIRCVGDGDFNGAVSTVRIPGTLQSQVYLGSTRKCLVSLAGGNTASVRLPREEGARLPLVDGQPVEVAWNAEDGILLRP